MPICCQDPWTVDQEFYPRGAAHGCFHGGIVFQDSASNVVRVQPHVSVGTEGSFVGKSSSEDWILNLAGVLVKNYHF